MAPLPARGDRPAIRRSWSAVRIQSLSGLGEIERGDLEHSVKIVEVECELLHGGLALDLQGDCDRR
jgi:hypothetical protein